jgi:UDPglucose 6-dehydrogenase
LKKIAVIGTGYVGLVSGTCFAEVGNNVVCCDIDHSKIDKLQRGITPIYEPGLEEMVNKNKDLGRLTFTTSIPEAIRQAEIIYIAVGTPMSITGEADLRYVSAVSRIIGENLNSYKVIVNKSTVPVGTGKLVERLIRQNLENREIQFDVVSNPEFLREGSALKDCMSMERAIIGAASDKAANIIADLHGPFNTQIYVTDLESAEMIKYASNCFLATKISFINSIANICERVGADVTKVSEGMGLDSRIGPKFLNAGIGYGGSCFPKDTHALVHIAESVGYDFNLMKSVIAANNHQRLIIIEKLKSIFGDLRGKKIAVLGLAFKPNTNDIRDAPALEIISKLLQLGVNVQTYDPVALEETKIHFGEKIRYYTDVYEAMMNCDACIVLTEWEEIINLDLATAKKLLTTPIMVDGRNCFSLSEMREYGFIYHSVGRSKVDK